MPEQSIDGGRKSVRRNMRVISGRYRGKKLTAPEGEVFRPTLDRVKETLFNILQFRIMNAKVLDLFAGSGALGIECLSRGADEVIFADNNRESIDFAKRNLVNIDGLYRILECDYKVALNRLSGKRFDIIFVDPPYGSGLYENALRMIGENEFLSQDGVAICEHNRHDSLPGEVGGLIKTRVKEIGSVGLSFYEWKEGEEK